VIKSVIAAAATIAVLVTGCTAPSKTVEATSPPAPNSSEPATPLNTDPIDEVIVETSQGSPEMLNYLNLMRQLGYINTTEDVTGAVFQAIYYCPGPGEAWGPLDERRSNVEEAIYNQHPAEAEDVLAALDATCPLFV
jgi:hypothetical protein